MPTLVSWNRVRFILGLNPLDLCFKDRAGFPQGDAKGNYVYPDDLIAMLQSLSSEELLAAFDSLGRYVAFLLELGPASPEFAVKALEHAKDTERLHDAFPYKGSDLAAAIGRL